MNEFDLIEQAAELFKLRPDKVRKGLVYGLLYPTGSPFAYGRPALCVYVRIDSADPDIHNLFACIRSIDDSGVSIWGPPESKEKATKRYENFIEFLQGLEYRCPTPEELRKYCMTAGLQEDYW